MSRPNLLSSFIVAVILAHAPTGAQSEGASLGASYEEIFRTMSTGTLHFRCAIINAEPSIQTLKIEKQRLRSPRLFRLEGLDWQEIPSAEFRDAGLTFQQIPITFRNVSWPNLPALPMQPKSFERAHRSKDRYFSSTEKIKTQFISEVNFERETIAISNATAFSVNMRFLRERFLEEHGPRVGPGPGYNPLLPSLESTERGIAAFEPQVREVQDQIREVTKDDSVPESMKTFKIRRLEQSLSIALSFLESAKERHEKNKEDWARVDQRTALQAIERERWMDSFGHIQDTFEHHVPAGALQFSGACSLTR